MRKVQAAISAIKPVLATRKRKEPMVRKLQSGIFLITNADSAVALSLIGWSVGLLETDIHGSKFPRW
jgi:hypothetical protein